MSSLRHKKIISLNVLWKYKWLPTWLMICKKGQTRFDDVILRAKSPLFGFLKHLHYTPMIHYTNFNRVVSAIEVYLRVFVRGLFPAVCATLATKGFFLWQKSYMKPPRRPLNYYTEFLKKVSLIILLLLPQLSAKKLSGFLIISLALIHEKQSQKLL